MTTHVHIGLCSELVEDLTDRLNELLANYQLLYMNARSFHWNIIGSNFFELHTKFEEFYNDALLKTDEIAERVLALGKNPVHSFSAFIKLATIEEVPTMHDGDECIRELLNGLQIILPLERQILKLSEEANDEGTNAMMSDYIRSKEKTIWMYKSYLK